MKVLIMVLSSNESIYKNIMNAQIKTWDSVAVENMQTIYYAGEKDLPFISFLCTPVLSLKCSDEYRMMHWKFKLALDHIWDLEWDYIFRTNSSTYVRKERIYEFLRDKPFEKYYAGENGYEFISGTGIVLSRDCAKIIKDQFTDEPTDSEDCLIGSVLSRNGIFPQQALTRLNYNFAEYKILDADYYRCKSEIKTNGIIDRNYDIVAFNELQKYCYP